MLRHVVFAAATLASLSVVASAEGPKPPSPLSSPSRDVAVFQANAGAPVKDFSQFGGIRQWQTVGDSAVALWTRPDTAYLPEVSNGCLDMEWSRVLSMRDERARVQAGFSDVLVRRVGDSYSKRCPIQAIRPLDVDGLRRARDEGAGGGAPVASNPDAEGSVAALPASQAAHQG